MGKYALDRFPVGLVEDLRRRISSVADELRETRRDLSHRKDEIGETGRNGAARHGSVFCLVRILDQNDASGLLDRLDADGPVRARTRKDYRKVVAPLRRERAEEEVDRGALAAWRARA